MARSTYVYLLTYRGRPKAAYTVKKELASWLRRQPEPHIFAVFRSRDGDPTPAGMVPIPVADLVRDE